MKNNPIGFIDSGLGGISVLKEVMKLLPFETYLYYGDSLHNPYGTKKEEVIYQYVNKIVKYLLSRKCKLIVIACNTATMVAIERLRLEYQNVLFVGTYPALKVAYDYYPSKNILVLGTLATLKSKKFQQLKEKYPLSSAIYLPLPKLAELIEKNEKLEILNYLKQVLSSYQRKVEVIVLGCTHYPFVKKELEKILGPVLFLDGSVGIARRVQSLLKEKDLLNLDCHQKEQCEIINSLDKKLLERSYQLLDSEL